MKRILDNIINDSRDSANTGKVADYIPELAKANPQALGICVTTLDGKEYYAGDYDTKFTIQSISKVITLMVAILENGAEYVFSKVGMEPTELAFNSITNLEIFKSGLSLIVVNINFYSSNLVFSL